MTPRETTALRLADVATAVGGRLVGDPDLVVGGIAPIDRAGASELTFLASPKYARLLESCEAGAVLVTPELEATPGPCANRIVVAKPHEAMLALLPRLYRMPERPFTGVHPTAVVAPDAQVDPTACVEAFTLIGAGATIGRNAWIGPHCTVADGVTVAEDARLVGHVTLYPGTEIGARSVLHAGVRAGSDGFGYVSQPGVHHKIPHVGRCLIGADVEIGVNSTIDRGSIDATVIGDGCKFDNLVHVGHNVRVGRLCLFTAGTAIAGSVRVEDGVVLAGQVGVGGHVTIGARAVVTAQAGVISDVPAGETWGGFPARPHKDAMRGYAALAKLPEFMKRVERYLRTKGE
ncbi:MAG TPA: UDP-3-O-(3-hydroxymyristoyl)glucosamine N-acyltransferase [Gemmatimonadaceae bacterium]|nr:UDP-3-O-(3-hydroxymyristoyl)glucosamine N-acyltransferase [Gemmatimonadaceae bacterium]